jgi:hypothetical protein
MIEAGSLNIATDTTLAILREIMRHGWLGRSPDGTAGWSIKPAVVPEPRSCAQRPCRAAQAFHEPGEACHTIHAALQPFSSLTHR